MIATTGLDERPRDPELGVPVPFVCEFDDGRVSITLLNKKRVIQCALSRICGICGAVLDQPVGLLGTQDELDRMAFHFPVVHPGCAEVILAAVQGVGRGVLGQDGPTPEWVLVTTGGFEHQRPQTREGDTRPTFRPNSVASTRHFVG